MESAFGKRAKSICCFISPRHYHHHGDPEGRKTIYDCLGPEVPWVSPVGRLDKDTSGLLLLTNDTDFANHVTDPASGGSQNLSGKKPILWSAMN